MISELFTGLRHIQGALAIGYSALLALWLLPGQWLRAEAKARERDEVVDVLAELFWGLPSGGRLAVVSTLALFVGSAVDRLILDSLVQGMTDRTPVRAVSLGEGPPHHPDRLEDQWDWAREGLPDARPECGPFAAGLVDMLGRKLNEHRQRYRFGIALVPLPFTAAAVGGCAWLLLLVLPAVLLVDGFLIGYLEPRKHQDAWGDNFCGWKREPED